MHVLGDVGVGEESVEHVDDSARSGDNQMFEVSLKFLGRSDLATYTFAP